MFDEDHKNGTPENRADEERADDAVETTGDIEQDAPNQVEETPEAKDKSDDASSVGEPKLGKVIPFDAIAETNLEVASAKEALDDAVRNLKTAFLDLKSQFRPLLTTIKEAADAIRETRSETSEREKAASQEQSDGDAETTEQNSNADKTDEVKGDARVIEVTRETTEAITQGLQKLKSRMTAEKLNLGHIISNEFESYADKHLTDADYTVDENGKRVVKFDAKFMQSHGNEMIPELIRGTLGTFFRNILNDEASDTVDATSSNGEAAEAPNESHDDDRPTNAADAEIEVEEKHTESSKYRVQFDFANAISNMIQNAKIVPQNADENADEESIERSKVLVIEGAKMTEDALNGKDVTNAAERIEKALEEAEMKRDPDYQGPEEIEAVDEKHRKILEMAKEFERSITAPDHPEESNDPSSNDK